MTRLSISDALSVLPAGESKIYNTTMQLHGFESGVGRAGDYSGHAHRFAWDIIFSPRGLTVEASDTPQRHGTLLIVAPETYFGPLKLGPFWFLKFVGRPGAASMPDKMTERVALGGVWLFDGSGSGEMPWYSPGRNQPSRVMFSVCRGILEVTLGTTFLRVEI